MQPDPILAKLRIKIEYKIEGAFSIKSLILSFYFSPFYLLGRTCLEKVPSSNDDCCYELCISQKQKLQTLANLSHSTELAHDPRNGIPGKLISFDRAGTWSQEWDPWQPDLNRENWHMIPGMESLANWSHSTVGTWSQKFYLKWSLVKSSAYCSAELLITHKCASWMLCDWKGHTKLMFEGSLWTALKILSMLDFFFKVQICPFLLIFQHLICHLTATTGAYYMLILPSPGSFRLKTRLPSIYCFSQVQIHSCKRHIILLQRGRII